MTKPPTDRPLTLEEVDALPDGGRIDPIGSATTPEKLIAIMRGNGMLYQVVLTEDLVRALVALFGYPNGPRHWQAICANLSDLRRARLPPERRVRADGSAYSLSPTEEFTAEEWDALALYATQRAAAARR